MDQLEAEYSFLAPTWKLPPVATTSMYPGSFDPTYSSPGKKYNSDILDRSHALHKTKFAPPAINRRDQHPPLIDQPIQKRSVMHQPGPPIQHHPPPISLPPPSTYQQSNDHYRNNPQYVNDDFDFNDNNQPNSDYNMPVQQHHNDYSNHHNDYPNQHNDNRALNYQLPPPPPQKRVQIIDHNRKTPSTDHISGRDSYEDSPHENHHPSESKYKPNRNQIDDRGSDSGHPNRSNNFNVHEYLYGLSMPDPGSYVNAYQNNRRRVKDDQANRKPAITQYRNFVQNGGFGPAFGNASRLADQDKREAEIKRKSYSKYVRVNNLQKVEDQRRIQNNGAPFRNRGYVAPLPKHRDFDTPRSHFLNADEDNRNANTIDKYIYFPKRSRSKITFQRSVSSPTLITSLTNHRRNSNTSLLSQSKFDSLHPWNQNDLLSGESFIDQSELHRNFHDQTRFNLYDHSQHLQNSINNYECPVFKLIEKKFITSHSVMNCNKSHVRLLPTSTLTIINEYERWQQHRQIL